MRKYWRKRKCLQEGNEFHIHLNSKKNVAGLCRPIYFLTRESAEILHHTCLLQYHIAKEDCDEVEFQVAPSGNRKRGKKPFYPMQKSTLDAMKQEVLKSSPSLAFRKVSSDAGGVLGAQQPGQLPRSRQQRRTDELDERLIYAKQKDEPIILEHHDVPEDLWALGTPHMCHDLSRFCCSEIRTHPFSVDPTFNFGKLEETL